MADPEPGSLSWRLSSHPITLIFFLLFRIGPLLCYLLGLFFTRNYVLIFILTMILLSVDFYNIKNIAGRRLVGLRWWNEVNPSGGDSTMVFESLPDPSEGGRRVNATDKRFFWLALYVQPLLWVGLAVVAIIKFEFIWLSLVGALFEADQGMPALLVIALVLTITNTVAFSRCDKFGQASNIASSALYSGNIAKNVAGGMMSRFFSR